MKIINKPSPNFDDRPDGVMIDMIIIHAIGYNLARALDTLTNPNPTDHSAVSAHYLIDHDGTIYAIVSEEKRAWHAGVSSWDVDGKTRENVNYCSIGIELMNKQEDFLSAFDERQINALKHLIKDIKTRHPIRDDLILGHDQIAPIRKTDPGPRFPWQEFRL